MTDKDLLREQYRSSCRPLPEGDTKFSLLGSGDFSIGSKIWPGTSKLLEEMGELQQVLGKLIAVHGATLHWDGDLRFRLVEELSDVSAALIFFILENLTVEESMTYDARRQKKLETFIRWHTAGDPPPRKGTP